MYKFFDLQLFDDDASAGAGNGADSSTKNNSGSSNNGYSMAQMEEIANARAERAEKSALKSYFQQQGLSEDEAKKAFEAYKAHKAAQAPDVSKITKERDEALSKLETLSHTNYLQSKGIGQKDMDYVLFKVSGMVTDKMDFEKAAEKFIKDNPQFVGGYHVSTSSGSEGGGSKGQTVNDFINAAIRKANK